MPRIPFTRRCSNQKYEKQLDEEPGHALKLGYDEMVLFANNFTEEIGSFQFGKFYHGKFLMFQNVYAMVKIWEVSETFKDNQAANLVRAMNEVILLQHERMIQHPGMIEFLGFCWDGKLLGAVYNFNPMDSVHNLIPKDTFTWLQRIKVALGFAHLLKFLHAGVSKFIVRNIAASHILVDKKYNPKLCDFGMIVGGIFPNDSMYKYNGCYGYMDPNVGCSGEWSEKMDVFSFGVILLNLITKRVDTRSTRPLLYVWAWDQFESCDSDTLSLVDQSLATDLSFFLTDGCEITNLAIKCVNRVVSERPTMKQVVKCLLKLEVIKENAEFLGLG